MKKIILILLSIITFTNCENEEQIPETIIGKWKLEKTTRPSDTREGLEVNYYDGILTLEFKIDGTVVTSQVDCFGEYQDYNDRFIVDIPCFQVGVFADSKEFSYFFKDNRLQIRSIDNPSPTTTTYVLKKI